MLEDLKAAIVKVDRFWMLISHSRKVCWKQERQFLRKKIYEGEKLYNSVSHMVNSGAEI